MAITATEAIKAIKDSKGIIHVVAARLGCTRRNVYYLRDKFSTVKEALEDERESVKDFAESKLFQQMDKDNITAIIFYLKTQAKDRGYIERQENVSFDLSQCTDEQLQRIAAGEHPAIVLSNTGKG